MRSSQLLTTLLAAPVPDALAHPGHAAATQPGITHLLLLHALPVVVTLAGVLWIARLALRRRQRAARHGEHDGKERHQ